MKTISMCAKCSDMCSLQLTDENGRTFVHDGYVPDFFPEDHCGDYIEFKIDVDTGQILNWKKTDQNGIKKNFQ